MNLELFQNCMRNRPERECELHWNLEPRRMLRFEHHAPAVFHPCAGSSSMNPTEPGPGVLMLTRPVPVTCLSKAIRYGVS